MSNTNESKTPRITKAMKFAAAAAMLQGEEPAVQIPLDDIVEALNKEVVNLGKKRSDSSKPTKTQKENEPYKEQILSILDAHDTEDGRKGGLTCSEIHNAVDYKEPYNIQKTSALLRLLGQNGEKLVVSEEVKGGKTLFYLA